MSDKPTIKPSEVGDYILLGTVGSTRARVLGRHRDGRLWVAIASGERFTAEPVAVNGSTVYVRTPSGSGRELPITGVHQGGKDKK